MVGFEVHCSSPRSGSGICLFRQPQNFLRAGVDSWCQMLKQLPCLPGLRNNIIHNTRGKQNQKPGKKEARKEATWKNNKGFQKAPGIPRRLEDHTYVHGRMLAQKVLR